MRTLPQPPRRTRSEGLVALFAALAVSSVGAREWEWHEEITPETELRRAQRISREGTNLLARGMFREAEERIGGGIGTATGKLRELEQRAATVGPLQSFVDRLQIIRDRFDDDWTNAIGEAFALEGPIKSYVATNPVIQAELAWPLRSFDWLRKELDSGNRRDAGIELRNFQDALRRQIGAFEELRRLEPSFRAVLDDLERTRKEPTSERKDATPDGTEFVRRDLTNALATAVATNPAPFSIPVPRSPPAPRVLPATFVLPEIPQEWRK